MLTDLIAKYHATSRAYQDAPDTNDSAEWAAYQLAEQAVLSFPCHSIEDVRMKAAFLLADSNALDTVKDCTVIAGEEYAIMLFLRSLLGEAP